MTDIDDIDDKNGVVHDTPIPKTYGIIDPITSIDDGAKFSFWKSFFCKHDWENVEAHAIVNGKLCGIRRLRICKKCFGTSAMITERARSKP